MEIQRMMIKRFATYLGMALAMCFWSFSAHAAERIAYFTASTFEVVGSHASESVKHELTLAQWRTGSQPSSECVASNLIALSNHYGLASAAPFGVPDWDGTSFS
jgi:hypothetical protein